MKIAFALTALVVLSGSIVYAERSPIDAVTECVHSSPDGRYTYSYVVNEVPTLGSIEMECAVSDHQRKTVARSQRSYELDTTQPRWNRRCVVVEEHGKHVFTRDDQAFSVTRAAGASGSVASDRVTVVDNAPCSLRAHAGRPKRLVSLSSGPSKVSRW